MVAGRTGVLTAALIYVLIIHFIHSNASGHFIAQNFLTQQCNYTAQKHFGFGRSVLFSTFIQFGMQSRTNVTRKQHFIRVDCQRGEQLIIVFCLLLSGDIHQCPGPLCSFKLETESPTIVKSTNVTVSDYPALQVHADFINIANIDSDYPPKFTVCSSSGRNCFLLENIKLKMDKGGVVGAIFLSLKKAFDTVDHQILICKLANFNLSPNVLNWMQSYLTGRV